VGEAELLNLEKAILDGHLQYGGRFTKLVEESIQKSLGYSSRVILTTSCTDALEMACHLISEVKRGEIILPSFAFSSCANAIIASGCTPVFCEVNELDFCAGVREIENLVNEKTVAIMTINYAGAWRHLMNLRDFCNERGIFLIEDNAHGFGVRHSDGENEVALGSFGDFSTLSFHATKNFTCGEGGALILNNSKFIDDALRLRDKGTDRSRFLLGQVDKYSWKGFGSSYGMSEINAAFLYAQISRFDEIQSKRQDVWNFYRSSLAPWAARSGFRLPSLDAESAAHIFALLAPDKQVRNQFTEYCLKNDVGVTTHYIPLHSSDYGSELTNVHLPTTDGVSERIIRLPLGSNYEREELEKVIRTVMSFSTNRF